MIRFLVTGAVAALAVAFAVPASADPPLDTNKNAITITVTCGPATITVTTIAQSFGQGAQVTGADTSVGVVKSIFVYSDPSRTVLVASRVNAGFEKNSLDLTRCDFTNPADPGLYFTAYVLFTPAST